MIKNVKFWIGENNPEYSKRVQEYLYTQCVSWGVGYEPACFTNKASLFVGGDGILSYANYDKARFDSKDKYTEMKLIETVTFTLEEVIVREKICIGDKTYYLDELTKALENIKPI